MSNILSIASFVIGFYLLIFGSFGTGIPWLDIALALALMIFGPIVAKKLL